MLKHRSTNSCNRGPVVAGWLCSLSLLLAASTVLADTYYVAPEGDNDAAGSASAPWRTIQRAVTAAGAGDLVIVRAGEYAGFTVEGVHASSQTPLVFRGEAGARVTSPGTVVPAHPVVNTALGNYQWPRWPHGITVQGSSHIIIEGFEVTGMPAEEFNAGQRISRGGAGILLSDCHHVTVRDNRSHDNGRWGIFAAFCDDLLVEGNEGSGSELEHGIYLSNSGDRNVVRGNHLFGNRSAGLHLNGDNNFHSDGYTATVDGVSSDLLVEQNIIHDNGEGGASAINCDGVQDSIIRNNLLYNNHSTGIALYQIDGYDAARRNTIVNNTIINAADSRWAILIVGCDSAQNNRCASASDPFLPEWERPQAVVGASTGTVIYNNIIYNHSGSSGAIYIDGASLQPDSVSAVGLASDSNLMGPRFWHNGATLDLAGWRAATGLDGSSGDADPEALFKDTGADDYSLVAGSAAIDTADSARAPAVDLLGNQRPVGAGPDMGAYEFCEAEQCAPSNGDEDAGPVDPVGPGPDASPGDGAPGGDASPTEKSGGCGCSGAGTGMPSWSMLLVLVLLLGLRATRRAKSSSTSVARR